MVRSEDDSWDIAGNVGSTALATAMVRAAETLRDDRLFADPFAQRFIDAAVAQGWQNPYGTDAWRAEDYDDPAVAQFRVTPSATTPTPGGSAWGCSTST